MYYRRLFPFDLFCRWLGYENVDKDGLLRREMSFTLDGDSNACRRCAVPCAQADGTVRAAVMYVQSLARDAREGNELMFYPAQVPRRSSN